mmetsp:Transcript_18117/g.35291  ORF Transcript_18117/g.35291 Transcript_18117/m.35291 type:complete len:151 (-) Transcript_18117:369-821(-)
MPTGRFVAAAVLLLCSGLTALQTAQWPRHVSLSRSSQIFMTEPSEVVPLANQVLVDLQTEPAVSSGGIFLPTAYDDDELFKKEPLRSGTVLAVGPGREAEDGTVVGMPNIKVGQTVMIAPTGGVKVEPEGRQDIETTVYLFKADEIWGVA